MRQTTLENGYCIQLDSLPIYSDNNYLFMSGRVTIKNSKGRIVSDRWSYPMYLAEYNYYKAIEKYDHI